MNLQRELPPGECTARQAPDQEWSGRSYGIFCYLYDKRAAQTLCVCLNRLLGVSDVLHLKTLAFTNI